MTQTDLLEVRRPPLRYFGGKFRIAPWIISHMPEHHTYVEVFGRGAGVLLRKVRSKTEQYNDIDFQVVNFFQVIRDARSRAQLVELIALTPFSRGEFELSFEASPDPIEAARRFCVRCSFGHGTASINPNESNGFRSGDYLAGKSYAREWYGIPEAIAQAGQRLQGVTIENQSFRKLVPRFNESKVLMYVDPPYVHSTRSHNGKSYNFEMTDEDHRQLAWLLKASRAKVMVSGYDSPLYNELYEGWRRDEKKTMASGQIGAVLRTEILWMNF